MSSRALYSFVIGLAAVPAALMAQVAPGQPDTTPADTIPTVIAALPASPPDGFVRIPVNTAVNFQILDAVSSKTGKIDQMFAIKVADPVMIDGRVVLPAGIVGEGQVVHAAKARSMGKAGELILAARYLQCGEARIALRGFKFGQQGADKATQAFVASMVVLPVGFFITGGEINVTPGTFANARLSAAVDVRVAPTPQCTGPAPMMVTPAAQSPAGTTPATPSTK